MENEKWTVGKQGGFDTYQVDVIFDENGVALAKVYGIPENISLTKLNDLIAMGGYRKTYQVAYELAERIAKLPELERENEMLKDKIENMQRMLNEFI